MGEELQQDAAKKEFLVSVAMAGAISAGAYTAGVIDFLVFALEEWEKHRDPAKDHRTVLCSMSGASAGAIVSTLSAVGLSAIPQSKAELPPWSPSDDCKLPELYRAWVIDPDLTDAPKEVGSLLDEAPLKVDPPPIPTSVLNSEALDRIGQRAISGVAARRKALAQPRPPLAYVAAEFHVFVTHSNLRGVPYEMTFGGPPGTGYGMTCHVDRAHYLITGVGTAPYISAWASLDPVAKRVSVPGDLDVAATNTAGVWGPYIQDTLGSAAFPVGLAARSVANPVGAYAGRMWPLDVPVAAMAKLKPAWPAAWVATHPAPNAPAPYVTWDGGIFNNEPFEYAHYTLKSALPNPQGELVFADNERTADRADRAVLMIDPFPDTASFNSDDVAGSNAALLAVLSRAFPTFIQQGRFKLEEMILALDDNVCSRWLIVPRKPKNPMGPEPEDLACGLLGGFGGFADLKFRDYDYNLGRKNCQDFLARWFGVAVNNPNVSSAYTLDGDPTQAAIVPLTGKAKEPVLILPWPQIGKKKVARIADQALARLDALLPLLLAEQLSGFLRVLAGIAWFQKKKDVRSFLYYIILADLLLRNQYDYGQSPSPTLDKLDRKILSACANPSWDFVTDIALARDLTESQAVIAQRTVALEKKKLLVRYTGPQKTKSPAYTWYERNPGWFWSLPVIGNAGEAVSKTNIKE